MFSMTTCRTCVSSSKKGQRISRNHMFNESIEIPAGHSIGLNDWIEEYVIKHADEKVCLEKYGTV